jgi:hypothetical protein
MDGMGRYEMHSRGEEILWVMSVQIKKNIEINARCGLD